MPNIIKLLFVDTNILLDFYRSRSETGLDLLEHLEQVSEFLISTFQLEMEFKKNRQRAMLEGLSELKPPSGISRPGLFSDAKAVQTMRTSQKRAAASVNRLRARYARALGKPTTHDPIYRACQRLFHKNDPLVLTHDDPKGRTIWRKALRRFLLGCPPRKPNDTSIGDAFNWEWMIDCATSFHGELVIVSRDSDYGAISNNQSYLNDHLRQEFSERVSKKRKILLYHKLSDALRHFNIAVTDSEEREEDAIVERHRTLPRAQVASDLLASAGTVSPGLFSDYLQFVNTPGLLRQEDLEWLLRKPERKDQDEGGAGPASTS